MEEVSPGRGIVVNLGKPLLTGLFVERKSNGKLFKILALDVADHVVDNFHLDGVGIFFILAIEKGKTRAGISARIDHLCAERDNRE